MASTEAELLREINADLPKGVDWKQGAITYLRELVLDGGQPAEHFHLTKPFLGGPDYEPFWVDVFHFLDVIQACKLAPRDLVIDVGCGPGWTVQWLAKLDHDVVGLDISVELLAVAEKRMCTDAHTPHVGHPFRYELREHDIEAEPLKLERPARLALFESTLHHFFNPVAALRNVTSGLAPDGVVAVIEAAAPPKGSEWDVRNVELMNRYHTIERPYTRNQLLDALAVAGLTHASPMRPVNGLFAQHADDVGSLTWEMTRADNINIVLASPTAEGIERLDRRAQTIDQLRTGWTLLDGASSAEARADGSRYRWCGPQVLLRLDGPGPHPLHLATLALGPGEVQTVRVIAGAAVGGSVTLTAAHPVATFDLTGRPGQLVELHSDRVFSPCWTGDTDSRVLSFMLDEPA